MNSLSAMRGIIWLASYPKSGNTWTRSFLHNLINIMAGHEDGSHDINAMNQFSTWEIAGKPYEDLLGKSLRKCTRAEIASVRHTVQQQIADRANGLAFVKTHHALVMDREKPTINFDVTCGAIYIVRNPLDVVISLSHHMNISVDDAIEQMGSTGLETPITDNSVYEIYSSWSQHVESWTRSPHRTIHIMRYEDMLDNPQQTFLGLARHLRLEPTTNQLSEAIERSSFDKLQSQEQEHGFREKPENAKQFFRTGKAGQWQEKLTQDQIEQILKDHAQQMKRYDYYPSGHRVAEQT